MNHSIMRIMISFAAMTFAACSSSPKSSTVTIYSTPSGAVVQVSGYGECETPCSIGVDGPRDVTVAKAGYLAQRFRLNPGDDDINMALELAAPTDAVDAETLPEID